MIPNRYRADLNTNTRLYVLYVLVLGSLKVTLFPIVQRSFGIGKIDVHTVIGIRHLGKYIIGTVPNPIVLVSLRAVERACEKFGVDWECGIETTIVHELGHAIQESLGLRFDEGQAERFAKNWYYDRKVIEFKGENQ
jgi:hypothetical protein